MANVQGTSAATNLRLRDGDDRIYVSDEAALTTETTTEFLTGTLDDIDGLLKFQTFVAALWRSSNEMKTSFSRGERRALLPVGR